MGIEYLYNIEQGTPEWLEARLGLITASVVKHILTSTFKVAKNDKARGLVYDLAAQRITGRVEEGYKSWDMERGHLEEDLARNKYHEELSPVKECGFIRSDAFGFVVGFSPDGLVGDDGVIEIKSRVPKYQVQTFCEDEVPDEYMLQIQAGMLISGRNWCDFIQYSNGMPMFVRRVHPDTEIRDALREGMALFEERIAECVSKFRKLSAGHIKTDFVEHIMGSEIEVSQ